MKRFLVLERINSSEKVAIYSPVFDGDDTTEFEKFISKYEGDESFAEDLDTILSRIKVIEEMGVEDRYFRYESGRNDNVSALPSHFDTSRLRLYCICYNSRLLILGNGGKKITRTYQEDPFLNLCVEDMKMINKELVRMIKKGNISFQGIDLTGDLSLTINDNTNNV